MLAILRKNFKETLFCGGAFFLANYRANVIITVILLLIQQVSEKNAFLKKEPFRAARLLPVPPSKQGLRSEALKTLGKLNISGPSKKREKIVCFQLNTTKNYCH